MPIRLHIARPRNRRAPKSADAADRTDALTSAPDLSHHMPKYTEEMAQGTGKNEKMPYRMMVRQSSP